MIVIILSPIVLKEKLNISKVLCVIIAMMGIFLIVKSDMSTLQNSKEYLKGHSIAIFCYIDPISDMFFTTIFLGENTTISQVIGGALILGSTFLNSRK